MSGLPSYGTPCPLRGLMAITTMRSPTRLCMSFSMSSAVGQLLHCGPVYFSTIERWVWSATAVPSVHVATLPP